MFRHEIKYAINNGSAHILRSRLCKICGKDRNADPKGCYRVTSQYFDDFCSSAVHDNLDGQLARKKFRIRIYNGNDSFIRLERKIKRDSGCRKDTAVLIKEQYEKIRQGDIGFMKNSSNPVFEDFYNVIRTRLLRPAVIVDYLREAYIFEPGNVRITLDRHIRSAAGKGNLFDDSLLYLPATDPGTIILEVKYTGFLPAAIKNIVQDADSIRQSASKYVLCRMLAQ